VNLHGIVRGAIPIVNPDISATVRISKGYTTDAAGNRTPAYTTFTGVQIQVQPLASRELAHIDYLNIQGELRKIYMYGNVQGVLRPSQEGGDLLTFAQIPGGTPQVWLTVTTLETWPDWCCVVACLQEDIVT
jgi:hypothetical protein